MAGDAIYANGDIHPAASTVGEVVQVAETQDTASSLAEDIAPLGDNYRAASMVEVVLVADIQDSVASMAEDVVRVAENLQDVVASVAEDELSAGSHTGPLNEQDFEENGGEGDTEIGRVRTRLVRGFRHYFIHRLPNIQEMETFRQDGPPLHFHVSGPPSAEVVAAANTLVMMRHADPVFTVRSTMPESRLPRLPRAWSGRLGNGGGRGRGRGQGRGRGRGRGRARVAGRRGGRH